MITKLRYYLSNNRIVISIFLFIFLFILANPNAISIISGIPVVIAGELMRVWSSGYIKKNDKLAVNGPYSLTRNPLYLGNVLLGIGFSIMGSSVLLLVIFSISFYLIYSSTILNEEERLFQKFGDEFIRYKNDVPRFFPRFHKISKGNEEFSWKLVKKHREYNTWIGIGGGIVLFIIKMIYIHWTSNA